MNKGDIVQIVDPMHHWYPCLIIVDEVKAWGIQGYMSVVGEGNRTSGEAYIRLEANQFEKVGTALVIRE